MGPAEIVADVPRVSATHRDGDRGDGRAFGHPQPGLVETRERETFDGFSIEESPPCTAPLRPCGLRQARGCHQWSNSDRADPSFIAGGISCRSTRHAQASRSDQSEGRNPNATLLGTSTLPTSMGSRLLARWILARSSIQPLSAIARMRSRRWLESIRRREAIREILKGAFDLERIAQKARFRRATPRDLGSLRRTLEILRPLREQRCPRWSPCSRASVILPTCSEICTRRS